jgi:hypothetical protein
LTHFNDIYVPFSRIDVFKGWIFLQSLLDKEYKKSFFP